MASISYLTVDSRRSKHSVRVRISEIERVAICPEFRSRSSRSRSSFPERSMSIFSWVVGIISDMFWKNVLQGQQRIEFQLHLMHYMGVDSPLSCEITQWDLEKHIVQRSQHHENAFQLVEFVPHFCFLTSRLTPCLTIIGCHSWVILLFTGRMEMRQITPTWIGDFT